MKDLIYAKNYEAIRLVLSQNPDLANEGLAFDDANPTAAHPLHRICDAVCANIITDDEAVEIARIFLEFGANVNGHGFAEKKDTPLIAAASLSADKVALLLLESGAEIHHGGCHGGTALHWAAWCGRPLVVKKLIEAGAKINRRCIDHQATPLFWAIHGYKFGSERDPRPFAECAKLLIAADADRTIPNCEGSTIFDLLSETDVEVREALR